MNNKFFTMLHLSAKTAAINSGVASGRDLIDIYVANSVLLHRTLNNFGYNLTIITNSSELVFRALDQFPEKWRPQVVEIKFNMTVPPGINFSSAHYKIEVFNYLSSLGYSSCLLDSDMVCLRDPSNLLCHDLIGSYDISEHVFSAYGENLVVSDIKKLSGNLARGVWYGGEFISSNSNGFSKVFDECMRIWPKYVELHSSLHHQGDEMVVTAALGRLNNCGLSIKNRGENFGVYRYWSGSVMHRQDSVFDIVKNCTLLHMPQDKIFMSDAASSDNVSPTSMKRKILFNHAVKFPRRQIGDVKKIIRSIFDYE